VKITDDYKAKIRLWAANPRVEPLPTALPVLPRFRAKKFANHEEMNRWKRSLLAQIARAHAENG
jgi:hypothetical protein